MEVNDRRPKNYALTSAEVLPFRIEEEMANRFPLYKCFAEAANRLNGQLRTKSARVGRKSDPRGSLFSLAVHERLAKINLREQSSADRTTVEDTEVGQRSKRKSNATSCDNAKR